MITRENTVLHIIDVQERLLNVMHNKEMLLDNMVRLLKGCQVLGLPILWMEQYPKGLGPTISNISELMPELEPMEKMCFSSCLQPDFPNTLNNQGCENVLIMGIEAHVCVYQTVSDLLDQGYHVEIVTDAVSSRSEHNFEMALRIMENMGAKLTTVEMALFELLREAGSEEFRKISRLVK